MRNKLDDWYSASKIREIIARNDEEKQKNKLMMVLAIIGVVTLVACIAFAVYKYMTPDYMDDFDDDFDDDSDDDYFDDEED